jgi:hypothetical protein
MRSEPGADPRGLRPPSREDPPPNERRHLPRFRLRNARGGLIWSGESGLIDCDAVVLNISGGGAAVLVHTAPSTGQKVSLRLPGEAGKVPTVEAVALASTVEPSGQYLVRIRFDQWVPLDSILEKHRERRMWERYPARVSRASLSWIEGAGEVTTNGELLNISGGGAAFIGTVVPPSGVTIWLQLDAGPQHVDPVDPVESRLVATSEDPSGIRIAHIQFVGPCPMTLFELAVHGTR